MSTDAIDITAPSIPPSTVAQFCGVPPNQISRLTANTIGRATRPAPRRGMPSAYSVLDAVLMRLGRSMLLAGVTPGNVQSVLAVTRNWLFEVLQDERAHQNDPQFRASQMTRWVVIALSTVDSGPELVDSARLTELLGDPTEAAPYFVVPLKGFLAKAVEDLIALGAV